MEVHSCLGELDVVAHTRNPSPWMPSVQGPLGFHSEFQDSRGEGEGVGWGRELGEPDKLREGCSSSTDRQVAMLHRVWVRLCSGQIPQP